VFFRWTVDGQRLLDVQQRECVLSAIGVKGCQHSMRFKVFCVERYRLVCRGNRLRHIPEPPMALRNEGQIVRGLRRLRAKDLDGSRKVLPTHCLRKVSSSPLVKSVGIRHSNDGLSRIRALGVPGNLRHP
jgi:hypothetical protein